MLHLQQSVTKKKAAETFKNWWWTKIYVQGRLIISRPANWFYSRKILPSNKILTLGWNCLGFNAGVIIIYKYVLSLTNLNLSFSFIFLSLLSYKCHFYLHFFLVYKKLSISNYCTTLLIKLNKCRIDIVSTTTPFIFYFSTFIIYICVNLIYYNLWKETMLVLTN